jgi:hypothetical protein
MKIENEINAQRAMQAYSKLEQGAIDEIDAAMFTGDMFALNANREDFIRMMDRWQRQLEVWEDIENENS